MRKTALSAVALLVLSACGSGDGEEPEAQPVETVTATETVTAEPDSDQLAAAEMGIDLDANPGLDLDAAQLLYEAEERCQNAQIAGGTSMVFSGMELRRDDGSATNDGMRNEIALRCVWNVILGPEDLYEEIRDYRAQSGSLQQEIREGIVFSWNWDDAQGLYVSLRAESDLDRMDS